MIANFPSQPETARAAANRSNAQLSTGPKTPEGKAKSSRNATRHGLYSKQLVMPGEDPAALDALRADLLAEHQPANTTEEILVLEMADQYWRLCRFRRMEASLFQTGTLNLDRHAATLRMMTTAERGFHKALATLTKLQKERGFVPQKRQPQPESVPQFTTATGFVSQNPVTPPAESAPGNPVRAENAAAASPLTAPSAAA